MIRDIVKYNGKEYQLTTRYFKPTNIRTTDVMAIENGAVSCDMVYHFVTTESIESQNKHKDILYNPEKYLSEEAIKKYLISRRNAPKTNFEKILSFNIDEFAEWLDKYMAFDDAPYMVWFDEKYCKKCEPIMCKYPDSSIEFPCAYCELEQTCKFFPEQEDVPDSQKIIKMWLEAEVEDERKET